MTSDTATMVLGALVLVVATPALYFVARLASRLGDSWSAHLLAPLAPAIGGTVCRRDPCIRGSFQGHALHVFFSPRESVGSGDSATSINAFCIEALDVAGEQDWRVRFHLSGLFGQGPKQLFVEVQDTALGQRLERSGLLAEIAAVSAPTQDYVTVAYAARRQLLIYTVDVSPRRTPSPKDFAAQLALVARLVQVNAQVNATSIASAAAG